MQVGHRLLFVECNVCLVAGRLSGPALATASFPGEVTCSLKRFLSVRPQHGELLRLFSNAGCGFLTVRPRQNTVILHGEPNIGYRRLSGTRERGGKQKRLDIFFVPY